MRSVRLQRNAWGGNMWDEQPLGQQTSDAFIRKHLNDAAATNNLHNCSHCLNHSDHQQASLDISLSGFHQPMIVIVMTSWWIYWPGSVALSIWATVGWLHIICYIFDWEPLIWSLYNQLWFITRHLKIKLRSGTSSNVYWMNQIEGFCCFPKIPSPKNWGLTKYCFLDICSGIFAWSWWLRPSYKILAEILHQ